MRFGLFAFAVALSSAFSNDAFGNAEIDRFIVARDMLLNSCLGYAENRLEKSDLSKGVEGLPGLIISNRGSDDPSSYCQVVDTQDDDLFVYQLLIDTLEVEQSPFSFLSEETQNGVISRHYRMPTDNENDIGLSISRQLVANSEADWVASVFIVNSGN